MVLQTPFLPHLLNGKAKPFLASVLVKGIDHLRHLSLPDLSGLISSLFTPDFFAMAPNSRPKRESIYIPTTLFWAFLFQVLNPDMACQGIVAKVRAWLITRPLNPKRPARGISAFCEARSVLSMKFVQAACDALRSKLTQQATSVWLGCGHEVKVLGDTSVSIPYTFENQQRWPQPLAQKPGCGFPVASILGVICLIAASRLPHPAGSLRLASPLRSVAFPRGLG